MTITYNGYHGTSKSAQQSIIREQHFRASQKAYEWAGTGIYFFIEDSPYDNAEKWAKYFKKIPDADIGILETEIKIESQNLFDVTLSVHQEQFHRFREAYYSKACKEAKMAGKVLDDRTLKTMNLDCTTFNRICTALGFTAVKRQCYIRFRNQEEWMYYSPSSIPNCTILCVRDETQIKKIKCAN